MWWKDSYSGKSSYSSLGSKKQYKSSLGWSPSKLSDYTSYYTSSFSPTRSRDEHTEDLLRKAYQAVKDMVVILDLPYQVYIQVVNNSSSNWDKFQKRIFIPTKVLDNPKLSDEEKINILCGSGSHETSHLMYSEYIVYDTFNRKLDKREFPQIDHESYIRYAKFIFDLIEDERVEDLLLQNRPGYSNFIENYKDFESKKIILNSKLNSDIDSISKFAHFFKTLIGIIRFPKLIDENILSKYESTYKKVANLMSTLPKSTKGSGLAALDIINIIRETLDDPKKGIPTVFDVSSISKLMYGIDRDSGHDRSYALDVSEKLTKSTIEQLLLGDLEIGVNKDTYFLLNEKKSYHKYDKLKRADKYREILETVRHLIPSTRNIVRDTDKNFEFNIYGCRSGKLDTNKLVEAYQGVPQVYIKEGQVVTNKATICVLIDESGSMGNSDSSYGSYSRKAREASILLNESLGKLSGVDLFMYGHSADSISSYSTEITVYRELGSKLDIFKLAEITGKNQNRDGNAIIETAKRLKKKMTTENAIMFVLSDGEPAARDYGGNFAIEDVRKNVLEAEKLGIKVIQISLREVYGVKQMFNTYIELFDINDLPSKLNTLIKNYVLKEKKSKEIRE